MGNISTEAEPFLHVETVRCHRIAGVNRQVGDVEDHHGLVDTVEHVKPKSNIVSLCPREISGKAFGMTERVNIPELRVGPLKTLDTTTIKLRYRQ